MPVLTRAGCNAGACHGAAAGRGGLHFSLLGSNPDEDFASIVHAFGGRRVHRSAPDKSLLLRKALGDLNHGGQTVLYESSAEYQVLRRWIELDVPRGSARQLTALQVSTSADRNVSGQAGSKIQLRAMASFDQQPPIDVTALTLFTVEDAESIRLDESGSSLEVLRPGRHGVIARYLNQVQPVTITRPFPAEEITLSSQRKPLRKPQGSGQSEGQNFVDEEIYRTLDELNIAHQSGEQVDDLAFARRVTLDLTGRLPTVEQLDDFRKRPAIDRYERLVDRLLASSAFDDYWTLHFARLLRLHALPNESAGVKVYGDWIRSSIREGTSWSSMTRQLLTATGDSHQIGPANFPRMVGDARAHAELVGSVMLGVRLGCANCHDHPLDRWTQDDYHGLAALLARVDRARHVKLLPRGDVTHPKTTQPARARLPGDRFVDNDQQPLDTLADWLADNPTRHVLAPPFVNRLWAHLFGRGLVEATDDLRLTNPATHPELLGRLCDYAIEHDYDLRSMLRILVLSRTYSQRSSSGIDRYYSRRMVKSLSPEVLADAIADVTGVPFPIEIDGSATRAVQLLDPTVPAEDLEALGRCSRAAACETLPSGAGGLAARLHLINGGLINRTLTAPQSRLQYMLDANCSDAEIVNEFTLRAYGRLATQAEIEHWCQQFATDRPEERVARIQDWLWSILCSRSFQRNW